MLSFLHILLVTHVGPAQCGMGLYKGVNTNMQESQGPSWRLATTIRLCTRPNLIIGIGLSSSSSLLWAGIPSTIVFCPRLSPSLSSLRSLPFYHWVCDISFPAPNLCAGSWLISSLSLLFESCPHGICVHNSLPRPVAQFVKWNERSQGQRQMGSTGQKGAGRFISVKYGQTCHHLFSETNRLSSNRLQESKETNYPAGVVSHVSYKWAFMLRPNCSQNCIPQLLWDPKQEWQGQESFSI